ncbi:MAG: sigma-54 dependent transcriptional regulator [Pseudomonadota bacterium]
MPIPPSTVLILDDDADIAYAAQLLLRRRFASVEILTDASSLPNLLKTLHPDVVLLDLNFTPGRIDGSEGLALLDFLKTQQNPPAVIVMTAYADVPLAVAALKRGADDFITKPWDNAHLIAAIDVLLMRRAARVAPACSAVGALIGDSAAMRDLHAMIASVAPTEANVMVLGENGVGKELVARAIHDASKRAGKTFLSVDMGALPESTFESELYGHRKGSFTGAQSEREGRFQAAREGTLFLDEIGNLPLAAQTKLLTVLERREVTPLGADRPVVIDVRIVSATNLVEAQLYQPNVFRPDLLFRLNTVVIRVASLRERRDDVPMLLNHYLAYYERQYQRSARQVDAVALTQLRDHPWPGNVRELRQACERAVILGRGPEYAFVDFGLPPAAATKINMENHANSVHLDSLERGAVRTALTQAQGNISHAAKALGVSRAALYRKIEKHGI